MILFCLYVSLSPLLVRLYFDFRLLTGTLLDNSCLAILNAKVKRLANLYKAKQRRNYSFILHNREGDFPRIKLYIDIHIFKPIYINSIIYIHLGNRK